MKIEFLPLFVQSAVSVLNELGISEVNPGEAGLAGQPHNGSGIVVRVGITGQLAGHVSYDLSTDTATAIAGVMLERKILQYDSTVQSAITELGNMISGRAMGSLGKEGYKVDITPPVIVTDTNIHMADKERPVCLGVPLVTEHGEISLTLSLRRVP